VQRKKEAMNKKTLKAINNNSSLKDDIKPSLTRSRRPEPLSDAVAERGPTTTSIYETAL
jgi:hypothetical protein